VPSALCASQTFVSITTGGAQVSDPSRFLYLFLNVAYGASIGAAGAVAVHQEDAWTGRPSAALLALGVVVIFGAAYLVTVTLRGRRPTLRGAMAVAASAAGVFALSSLAVSAPAWVLVWTAAALVGFATGVLQPLPSRGRAAV
jgi:hypothetical protein